MESERERESRRERVAKKDSDKGGDPDTTVRWHTRTEIRANKKTDSERGPQKIDSERGPKE